MWYFYILQSQKDLNYFYKGSTSDPQRRLEEHNKGLTQSNRNFRPFRLVYFEAYLDEETARLRERSVKRTGSVSVPLLKRIKESLKRVDGYGQMLKFTAR
ncbi:MAG: GIY-YIG nuclease family protein [Patescibacteria group bacterium]